MYPILVCSLLSVAIFLEKLWMLRVNKVIPPAFIVDIEHMLRSEKIQEAIALCREIDTPLSRILLNGIRHYGKRREELKEILEEVGKHEAAHLDNYIETLGTIASIATLLGLLGTISGMIQIFRTISHAQTVSPTLLAGGISEALYTTAAGLSVAIPTIIFYRYLSNKSDRLILQMEEHCLRMIELLKERHSKT